MNDIRQLEPDKAVEFDDKVVRQHARPTEASSFDNLVKTAQRSIDNNSGDFESHLDDLRSRNFMILWRQDRSEEHTSELQSLMRISYAVFCLNNKNKNNPTSTTRNIFHLQLIHLHCN